MLNRLKQWIKKRTVTGGVLWHVMVFPQRFLRHGLKLLKEPFLMRDMEVLVKPLQERQLVQGHVSVVITSAGRKEYLKRTIEALRKHIDYNPEKLSWLIIDDYPDSKETHEYIDSLDFIDCKIFNEKNRGLGYSLNRIFAEIKTEFVLYCQEDFEVLRPVNLEDMVNMLQQNPHISQLILSRDKEFRGTKKITDMYREYEKMFAFWPFVASVDVLRRFLPFPLYFTNVEFSFKIHQAGRTVSGIFGEQDNPYVQHIGEKRKVWVVK